MTENRRHSASDRYRDAGVDVNAGYRAVDLMRAHVASTRTPGVLGDIGGFGGLFRPDLTGLEEPVLIGATDGVGTKLRIAQLLDRHDTIGIDCVAMCVNDLICAGAVPLFFLDYIAVGRNIPERVAAIVAGVAAGCRQAGCALIGGETAEMPGLYAPDAYDIAGFAVGLVDRPAILDGSRLEAGDTIIGLASSGLHSNGFSLVRQVLDVESRDLDALVPELGMSLGEALLEPTRIYARSVAALRGRVEVRAVAHITGGGWHENLPRLLPDCSGLGLEVRRTSGPEKAAIFAYIEERGKVPKQEMYHTFNMGLGLALVVAPAEAEAALAVLTRAGETAWILGSVTSTPGLVLT